MPGVPAGAVSAIMPGATGGIYRNLNGAPLSPYRLPGEYAGPNWGEQVIVKEVKPQFPWDLAESLSRETPVKLYAKAQIDLPIQVVMRADVADGTYNLWVNAAFSRLNTFDLLVLNNKLNVPGALGVRGEYLISMPEEPQPIDGTLYATFELKPTRTPNGTPLFALVGAGGGGGAVIYTPITYQS